MGSGETPSPSAILSSWCSCAVAAERSIASVAASRRLLFQPGRPVLVEAMVRADYVFRERNFMATSTLYLIVLLNEDVTNMSAPVRRLACHASRRLELTHPPTSRWRFGQRKVCRASEIRQSNLEIYRITVLGLDCRIKMRRFLTCRLCKRKPLRDAGHRTTVSRAFLDTKFIKSL